VQNTHTLTTPGESQTSTNNTITATNRTQTSTSSSASEITRNIVLDLSQVGRKYQSSGDRSFNYSDDSTNRNSTTDNRGIVYYYEHGFVIENSSYTEPELILSWAAVYNNSSVAETAASEYRSSFESDDMSISEVNITSSLSATRIQYASGSNQDTVVYYRQANNTAYALAATDDGQVDTDFTRELFISMVINDPSLGEVE
jgi:hypothetical protein